MCRLSMILFESQNKEYFASIQKYYDTNNKNARVGLWTYGMNLWIETKSLERELYYYE